MECLYCGKNHDHSYCPELKKDLENERKLNEALEKQQLKPSGNNEHEEAERQSALEEEREQAPDTLQWYRDEPR